MNAARCVGSVLAALVLVLVSGCGEPATCTASGGEWNDCAVVDAWCDGGVLTVNDQDRPAMCETGCSCPSEAPVWDAEFGCITEASCVGARPTGGQ